MKKILSILKKHKYLWLFVLYPVSILFIITASCFPEFAEFYALHIYRPISLLFGSISGIFPFSVAEWTVIILAVCAVAFIIISVYNVLRSKGRRIKVMLRQLSLPICAGALVFFLFVTNCGINYYRIPFTQSAGLKTQDSSVSELKSLCLRLASIAGSLRVGLSEDGSGVFKSEYDFNKLSIIADNAYKNISCDYPLLANTYKSSKSVFFSEAMSYLNITGMFFPFTFEANVNTHVTPYKIPFTLCHELAHLQGYMKEDEANFIAFLACMGSDDKEFKYSGAVEGLTYALNSLYKESKENYFEVYNYLCEGIKRDLAYNSEYIDAHDGKAAQSAAVINDIYLRANNSDDGVKSYGKMVDLLLAYYRS